MVNTQLFREAAIHFDKHKKYTFAPAGSTEYADWWDEEKRRTREGYSVGGLRITGDHYYYLNYCQIQLTDEDDSKIAGVKHKKSATKKKTFPAFWDGDKYYFDEVEIARNEGEHMIIGKARRKGFSYKNGAICSNRYNNIANSTTLIIAYDKKYLYPRGTMTMTTDYVDWVNEHTDWGKRKLIDKTEHIKSGYQQLDNGIWVDKGYKSEIMALTAQDNPGVARGKDGTLILLEEAGKFPNLKETYLETKPTVESGVYTTGQILVFGTGGGDDSNWEDFEEMFYAPEEYGFRAYNNEWDEGAEGNMCGFFVPYYINKDGFIDSQGNSLVEAAILHEEELRDNIKKIAKDPSTIDKRVAEYPGSPSEAFLRIGTNIFPKKEIQSQINKIQASKLLQNIGVAGFFTEKQEGIIFEPSADATPITKFPHKKGENLEGCWVIYEDYIQGARYYASNDPYSHDKSIKDTSLGSTFIMKAVGSPGMDDIIAAEFTGRPQFMDEYNRQMLLGVEYYRCKLGFENMTGDVQSYATRFKKLHLLEEQFDLSYNSNLNKSPVQRPYGMHMTDERKGIGEIYVRDWLITPRAYEGEKKILNVHTVYSLPLLYELLKYNKKGNFDRVMAFMIGRFFAKEIEYDMMQEAEMESSNDDFFNRTSYFGR